MPLPLATNVHYANGLADLVFEPEKPVISILFSEAGFQLKRVALHAGASLACHSSPDTVIVTCLRGKGRFTVDGVDYVMQPGSIVSMSPNTPHGAIAETDCVFVVSKIRA